MEVRHEVRNQTEFTYGYLQWKAEEDDKYRDIFPKNEFDVVFMGKRIYNRKVDWKRHRINLYPIRHLLSKGDVLILHRDKNSIYIEKEQK